MLLVVEFDKDEMKRRCLKFLNIQWIEIGIFVVREILWKEKYKIREFRYDGSRYYGFQDNPNKITVQGEIEKILKISNKEDINLISAGRTDRGVHANHQVSNFLYFFKYSSGESTSIF